MNDSPKDFADDPRLSAYALGELEGAERAAIEALVRDHPAAAAAVEEIRRLAGSLADALEGEAIELRPAAEIVPIDSGRRSALRRLQPYLYIASGLAAGWASALLIFRPAPRPRAGSSAAVHSVPEEKKSIAFSAAPASVNPGTPPQQTFAFGFVGSRYPWWPQGDPLPRVQSPAVAGAIIDSSQLREDLKHFELVQPALGAGQRIPLNPEGGDHVAQGVGRDSGTVKLSPFEVTSGNQDSPSGANSTVFGLGSPTANTLSGTRINSKLSDIGGSVPITTKEQMLSYADDAASAKTISGATIPPGIADWLAPASAGSSGQPSARVVYGRGELLPLAGASGSAAEPGPPQTPAGIRIGNFAAAAGGRPATDWAPDPLRAYLDQLRTLKMIDGTQAGQAALPGRFAQLYPTFLLKGSQAAYERMMADSNAEVSAMGALCLMTVYPHEREAVLAKMGQDLRPVTYVRAGSAPQPSTLGALFRSIGSDPGFLLPLGTPPPRP